MKKTTVIRLSIISIVILIIISSCSMKKHEMPDNFNFLATWGVMEDRTFDSYNNLYIRALDWERDTIISFPLSHEQKERIYKIIVKNKLASYPSIFDPETDEFESPATSYYLKFEYGDVIKEITWESGWVNTRESRKLRKVFDVIEEYLLVDERIINLPPSERWYM